MTLRNLPGMGLSGFWDVGAEYKGGMDANLRLLSALAQAAVLSRTTALPGTGGLGDIYIVPEGAASNANEIAIWDGEAGSETWEYVIPQKGWRVFVKDTDTLLVFNGTAWVDIHSLLTGSAVITLLNNTIGHAQWQHPNNDANQIVSLINQLLGSTDWQSGGGTMPGADIKVAYEGQADTNAFTDAEKAKLAGLEGSKFLGTYTNLSALNAAHPSPDVGSYAHVDMGVGQEVVLYVWDNDDNQFRELQGSGTAETGASIKSKLEAEPDTNTMTDAEKAKLAGVETGATGDQTGAEMVAAIDSALGGTAWQGGGGGGGGLADAPVDGSSYLRKDGAWELLPPFLSSARPERSSQQNLQGQGGSAISTKGQPYTINETVEVSRVYTGLGISAAAGNYQLVIAQVGGSSVQAPVFKSTPVALSAGEQLIDFEINPPVQLDKGNTYFVGLTVKDNGPTQANRVYTGGNDSSHPFFGANLGMLISSDDLVGGESYTTYGSTYHWFEFAYETVSSVIEGPGALTAAQAGKVIAVNAAGDGFEFVDRQTPLSLTADTAAITLVEADFAGNVVKKINSAAAAVAVTVPPGLNAAEPLTLIRTGAGAVSVAAGAGVTINSRNGDLTLDGRYAAATLIPDGTDTYLLVGALTT